MSFKRIFFYGVVQGVGFRPAAYRVALGLGMRGYVRNNGSNVEVVIDGDARRYIDGLKAALPPLARIERTEVEDAGSDDVDKKLKGKRFIIMLSREGQRASAIPADTALCEECRKELLDRRDRRYGFPFTNCTDCGARFSVIRDVPYDRKNTSMDKFAICPVCQKEYADPQNRRFHAQTISCPHDGPRYSLYDGNGNATGSQNPVGDAAGRLDAGELGVLKGWGGMHIACRMDATARLRRWYGRPRKPFAVMVRDLATAQKMVSIDDFAKKLLSGPERPIVLLPGKTDDREGISPGLGNIGVYLPYSGLHHLLFSKMRSPALIMTSANPAGEPMLLENDDAFSLGLDFCLLHDRKIINRVDDSVVIPYRGRRLFIRKSRGYVPGGIEVPYKDRILSVGAERNVTSAVSSDNKVFATQYIGTTYRENVYNFQEHATKYLMRLLGVQKLDGVVTDLHPQYATRKLGAEMALSSGARLSEIQHHWAHAASLMLDNGLGPDGEIVCLALDGVGYGTDAMMWGGEVLVSSYEKFERVGTLRDFPLIGGDAAVREPARLVFGMLGELGIDATGWWQKSVDKEFSSNKAGVLEKMRPASPRTTSIGRMLDALSCYLGICTQRSYDGEPAMMVEPFLERARKTFNIDLPEPVYDGKKKALEVDVIGLFGSLHDVVSKMKLVDRTRADLALCIVEKVVGQLTDIALDAAEKRGITRVGITGGVSYNLPITDMFVKSVEKRGLLPLLHDRIPNGDGGISLGQNVIAGMRTLP